MRPLKFLQRRGLTSLSALALLLYPAPGFAAPTSMPASTPTSAPAQAEDVAALMTAALPWANFSATLAMRVSRDNNKLKQIKLRMIADAQGQAMRLDFEKPSKLRGMKFLAIANRDASDTWAIYLRMLRRVMTVPLDASNVMVRDMINLGFFKPRPELFHFKPTGETQTLEDETLCRLIAVTPKDADARRQFGFDRSRLCLDEAHRVRRVEFFEGDKLIRHQTVISFHETAGGLLPKQIRAVNTDDGEITEIFLNDMKVNAALPRRVFTRRAISRK